MDKIGFIGTGVMGAPMALHLAKHYDVGVYNRSIDKALRLQPHVTVYDNIQALVENSTVIITIVGYPQDVSNTYKEVFKYLKSGTICIDMTTSSPSLAKDLAKQARQKGAHLLDVPVTGGDQGALNQTLTMMAGGDEIIFERVKDLLKIFGNHVFYMGSSGSGQYAKLANQIAIAGNICALAESLSFAKAQNLDLTKQLDILKSGSAASFQANVFGQKMLNHDYEPGFYVKHFMKDLQLVLDHNDHNLPLKITETVLKAYQTLGQANENNGTQSIYDYYLQTLI